MTQSAACPFNHFTKTASKQPAKYFQLGEMQARARGCAYIYRMAPHAGNKTVTKAPTYPCLFSAVGEVWLSLFKECTHPLLLVLQSKARPELAPAWTQNSVFWHALRIYAGCIDVSVAKSNQFEGKRVAIMRLIRELSGSKWVRTFKHGAKEGLTAHNAAPRPG